MTVILENVHDPFNIGAVLRSCDSVGIREIFVLYTEKELLKNHLSIGRRTAMGTQKWVDVHLYKDVEACMAHVRKNYQNIMSTYLSEDAKSLYDLDLTQSIALMFGNEHNGLSDEVLAHSDGNFLIPQMGMAKSLNISVACAISLYEAMRQRLNQNNYGASNAASDKQLTQLLNDYIDRHESDYDGKDIRVIK